jgi:hypothetical protein
VDAIEDYFDSRKISHDVRWISHRLLQCLKYASHGRAEVIGPLFRIVSHGLHGYKARSALDEYSVRLPSGARRTNLYSCSLVYQRERKRILKCARAEWAR